MQIFNHTNKDAIFYQEKEAKELTPVERASKAIKEAQSAVASSKIARQGSSEPHQEMSAYDRYRQLMETNPRLAGVFWRENKDAILACANLNQ
ncbi:MAG: hypothetical protein ACPIA7_05465 [Akkermansiaceae bacterium]